MLKSFSLVDPLAAKVPEMTKLNNLQSASSRSLFHIVHKILDDSIENRKVDVPYRVVCILKNLVQMIERRSLKQAEDFKKVKLKPFLCIGKFHLIVTNYVSFFGGFSKTVFTRLVKRSIKSKMRVFKTLVRGAMEESDVALL